MLTAARQEISDSAFDARGCSGIEARALRDAKMEGVEQTLEILSDFLDVTPKATAQSDINSLLIEDEEKESE